MAGARARLSMPDAYSWTRAQFQFRQRPNGTLSIAPRGGSFNSLGHFTEDFAAVGVISEMLLQSVADTRGTASLSDPVLLPPCILRV